MFFVLKALISGLLVAAVSGVSRRYPGWGGLLASLPLISVLGMTWLWIERPDAENMAHHVESTIWFVLPSMPMFLLIPWLIRRQVDFWISLGVGCAVTVLLYTGMIWLAPKVGLRL